MVEAWAKFLKVSVCCGYGCRPDNSAGERTWDRGLRFFEKGDL
jgi:hypothetical protein